MGSKTPATTTQNQNQTTNSVTNPWSAATPLLQSLISKYSGVNTDPTQAQTDATGNLVNAASGIPSFAPQATGAVNNTFGNAGMLNSNLDALKGNLGATASGANLDPYKTPGFGDALSTAMSDITKNIKGVYAGSGRDPSGAGSFAGSLGRGLTQGIAPIIQSQANQNTANMLNANNTLFNAGVGTAGALNSNTAAGIAGASAIPGLTLAPATAQVGAANTQQQLPFQNLLAQLQAAGMLGGMGGTSSGTSVGNATGTQTPANDPLMNIIGGVTAGAGLVGAFSDENLKEDIKPIGKLYDGQDVFSYRFKGSNVPQIGLLAQDVEKAVPEAVGESGGFKTVRYDIATRRAHKLGMLTMKEAA
jgi:hypothetical protein